MEGGGWTWKHKLFSKQAHAPRNSEKVRAKSKEQGKGGRVVRDGARGGMEGGEGREERGREGN